MNDSALIGVHRFKGNGALALYRLNSHLSCVCAKACFALASVIVNVKHNAHIAAFASVRHKRSQVLHCVKVVAAAAHNRTHVRSGKLKHNHAVLLGIGNVGVRMAKRHKNLFDIGCGFAAFKLKNFWVNVLCFRFSGFFLFRNFGRQIFFCRFFFRRLFFLLRLKSLLLRLFFLLLNRNFFCRIFCLFLLYGGLFILNFLNGTLLRLFFRLIFGFLRFFWNKFICIFALKNRFYFCGNGFKPKKFLFRHFKNFNINALSRRT